MAPDSEFRRYYLASILLRSDAYEAELNEQILEALRHSPSAPDFVAPAVLAGPPNRCYFIESFLAGLVRLPFAVEILTSAAEIGQQIDRYDDGLPDPGKPGGLWRAMLLDIQVQLSGTEAARIFLRELPSEELVQISFAFDAAMLRVGGGLAGAASQSLDLLRYREFLLALVEAYPVLVGTLGFDLNAVDAGLPDNQYWLENRMSFSQLAGVLRPSDSDQNFDFVIISATVAGGNKPFVYDGLQPGLGALGPGYHDLRRFEELHRLAAQAETAYGRMYESKYPKDDRDDALGFLAQAIRLAGSLGLVDIEADLQHRYDHINGVFNAQFRW